MATKTMTERPANLLSAWAIERELGAVMARPFLEKINRAGTKADKLAKDLAAAREEQRLADMQAREAMKLAKGVDLSAALKVQPYDAALRACLGGLKTTRDGEYDQKTRKYVKKPIEGVVAWAELQKAGATDEQIGRNLEAGFGYGYEPVKAAGHKLAMGEFHKGTDTYGGQKLLSGKRLVEETRRLLKIPHPPKKAPEPKKPAAKKPPVEIHVNTRDEKGKKRPLSKKTAKAVGAALVEAAKQVGAQPATFTGKKASTAAEAADVKKAREQLNDAIAKSSPSSIPGEWIRAARKAMVRARLDPAMVKDEFPWQGWHAGGFRPAAAVKAFKESASTSSAQGKQGGAKAGEEKPAPAAKPAKKGAGKKARILEANPSGRSRIGTAGVLYDTFDLGVGAGEIAAADQTKLVQSPGLPELTAVVSIGTDPTPYVVVRSDKEPVDTFRLYPLVGDETVVPMDFHKDQFSGRFVSLMGTRMLVQSFDDGGILVKDEGPDAKPPKPRLIDTIDDDPADPDAGVGTPATGAVAVVDSLPEPGEQGRIRGHRFVREELADAYAGTVDDVRDGKVRKWVVVGDKEYVVSGMSNIHRDTLSVFHLHPLLPQDMADPEKSEGIVPRKAKANGRPISWDWLLVELPNGAVAVLGEKKDELILETPGPKAGK